MKPAVKITIVTVGGLCGDANHNKNISHKKSEGKKMSNHVESGNIELEQKPKENVSIEPSRKVDFEKIEKHGTGNRG